MWLPILQLKTKQWWIHLLFKEDSYCKTAIECNDSYLLSLALMICADVGTKRRLQDRPKLPHLALGKITANPISSKYRC